MKRVALAIGVLLMACTGGSTPAPTERMAAAEPMADAASAMPAGVTDAMIEEGQAVFGGPGVCAACHGADGSGGIGPNLADAEWLIGDGSYAELVETITTGVPASQATFRRGAVMPPRGGGAITPAQIQSVAAFVWTLSH
jgi:mono/diheme cytochrome c family protein